MDGILYISDYICNFLSAVFHSYFSLNRVVENLLICDIFYTHCLVKFVCRVSISIIKPVQIVNNIIHLIFE